ncbi:hypothetical protein [Nostoc commune]|uniref:hypothetical protein n=1 Tax=Nostoc commune TaxID=1178 RepID=UPI002074235D|nr:hypothetical protein [Nostoc commune]
MRDLSLPSSSAPEKVFSPSRNASINCDGVSVFKCGKITRKDNGCPPNSFNKSKYSLGSFALSTPTICKIFAANSSTGAMRFCEVGQKRCDR